MVSHLKIRRRLCAVRPNPGRPIFTAEGATVSIVHDNRRYVVALRFVEYGEEMEDIVRWLLRLRSRIS
jgi:hypothetical protein